MISSPSFSDSLSEKTGKLEGRRIEYGRKRGGEGKEERREERRKDRREEKRKDKTKEKKREN